MADRSSFIAPRAAHPAKTQKALTDIQESLDTTTRSPYTTGLQVRDFTLRAGQYVRVSPPAAGMVALLPPPGPSNGGDPITIAIEKPKGTLTIRAAARTKVNGGDTATFTESGVIQLFSNGLDEWASAAQLPAEAPGGAALDAEYLLGAAHGSLPNGRVATDSTEIDADLATPGVASWALRTASVVLGKLQNLTGLSVLGRASNSAGVMAAITASGARQALMSDAAGSSIGWRSIETADVPAHTWAETLAAGNSSGASNAQVDAGQHVNFGAAGPTTGNPQLRSGESPFRMRGAGQVIVTADGSAAALNCEGNGGVAAVRIRSVRPVPDRRAPARYV